MTIEIVVSLEVQNGFDFPKQAELVTAELVDMSARLEDGPEYTEEDELLVHAFEGEYHSYDGEGSDWIADTIAEFSTNFPELVFSLDVKDDSQDEEGPLLRREYYLNGKRQVVEPYVVVPDFDPAGELEDLADGEDIEDDEEEE
jgi:hypothetical protein